MEKVEMPQIEFTQEEIKAMIQLVENDPEQQRLEVKLRQHLAPENEVEPAEVTATQ
jgi:hypothetical protein